MDREKQIEEMATVINEMDERNAHYYDKYMIECEAFADANAIAKALYNKGYRREDDIAKEIFEKLYTNIKFNGHTVSVWKNDLIEAAKEYGISLE